MIRRITEAAIAGGVDWPAIVAALAEGHRLPRAEIGDLFLPAGAGTMLVRAASIPGLGCGVKTATIQPENPARGLPSVQGGMQVFAEETGTPEALIDNAVITRLKTAADSVLGARLLARPDSETLLIIGAGAVADSLIEAYPALFPSIDRILIWNRTAAKAETLAEAARARGAPVAAATELRAALAEADIVSTATMATAPVLFGADIRPGTHVDLIGAFKADMREADDALLRRARLFVDSRETTIHHIGELMIPLASGAIGESDVLADLYDLIGGAPGRLAPEDVTVFKNGGGAHLDLMTARAILANL